MKFKKNIFYFMIVLLFACSPLDREYNKKTVQDDLSDIKEMGMPQTDVLILSHFLEMEDLRNNNIDTNLTYSDILTKAKAELLDEILSDLLTKEIKKQEAKKTKLQLDTLNQQLSFSLISKDYDADAYAEFFNLDIHVKNKSSKDIKALRGILTFMDIFGDVFKKHIFKCDELIPSKQSIVFTSRIIFNPLLNADIMLMEKDINQIYFSFKPTEVLFTDGTSITLLNY